MRVTVLNEVPVDTNLCGDWNRLVGLMEQPEVFFTYQWSLAASRAFKTVLTPLLFLIHEADELRGVASLAVPAAKEESAIFLTASTADYCDVVSAPETRAEVLDCLLQEINRMKLRDVTLGNLPADSSTWKHLSALASDQHLLVASRPAYECGVVEFGSEHERRTMVHSVAHKSREQRGLKKLSRIGPVSLRHLVSQDEIEACLPQMVAAQVSRFLASNRLSPLIQYERRTFLRELTALLSAEAWLKVSFLEVGGRPVAWNYGFRFTDSWFWYLPSFHFEYENCSPGSCLLRLLVEEGCADLSLRRLDLGLGDESYKHRFATRLRRTVQVQLSRNFVRHGLICLRQSVTTGAMRFPNIAVRLRQAMTSVDSLSRRLHEDGLAATSRHIALRAARLLASRDEILVFEASAAPICGRTPMRLDSTTWESLAGAAIKNSDDPGTLQRLLRAGGRLKNVGLSEFALRNEMGEAVHLLSIANSSRFHVAEIDHILELNRPRNAVIFDCWTPARFRGLGYYPLAIRMASAELMKKDEGVWIFCAATNTPSLRGILKAGFAYRFSLVRLRRLGSSIVVRQDNTTVLPLQ